MMSWPGRGGAPGVVAPVAEQHVHADAGEGRAAGVDPGPVHVHVEQELRRVVGRLRAEHRDRTAGLGLAPRHEQRVGHSAGEAAEIPPRRESGWSESEIFIRFTVPRSGIATPPARSLRGSARYGKRLPRTVSGASGSSAERRSAQTRLPPRFPKRFCACWSSERRVELAAAALPEDPADEAGGGDHVGDLPVLRARLPDRRVLARHLQRVDARLVDVGVDAGHVVRDVLLETRAGGAVDLVRQVVLALEVLLAVGRELPLGVVLGTVAGAAAGERGQLRAARVPQRVHGEQPVLGAHVAEPEHRGRARLPVDVRHAEAAVADDRHLVVAGRRVDPLGAVLLHTEGRVLEVLGDVGLLQARSRVHQVAVHLQLVRRVLRPRSGRAVGLRRRAGCEELREVRRVREAVRARRQDVPEAAAVFRPVRLDGRVGRQAGQPGQLR